MRQLASRKRLLIILLLAGLPVVMSVARSLGAGPVPPSEVDDVLVNGMLASAILPIVALAISTAAFGNEVEDRTLNYLVLNPIARWRIVLPKLLAAISIGGPILLVSSVASTWIILESDLHAVSAVAVAMAVGISVYSSLFLWLGLMSSRALGFGLLYVFLWEGLFSSFVDGIRYLSIREYTIAIAHGLDPDRFSAGGQATIEFPAAAIGSAAVFALFLTLSVHRLRKMDVP